MKEVLIKDIAFARSGDKGDISNIHVHPYRDRDYDLLLEKLTVERVGDIYDELIEGPIKRYELEGIKSINFVMYNALGGGVVGRALNRDIHGKSRGNLLMDTAIEVPDEYEPPAKQVVIEGHSV